MNSGYFLQSISLQQPEVNRTSQRTVSLRSHNRKTHPMVLGITQVVLNTFLENLQNTEAISYVAQSSVKQLVKNAGLQCNLPRGVLQGQAAGQLLKDVPVGWPRSDKQYTHSTLTPLHNMCLEFKMEWKPNWHYEEGIRISVFLISARANIQQIPVIHVSNCAKPPLDFVNKLMPSLKTIRGEQDSAT